MRISIAVVIAVLAFVGALIGEAPATLADARLDALSGGRLRIADATGTLWQGSGELALTAGGLREPIAWRIDPWVLLRGELRGSVTREGDGQEAASFDAGRDRFELRGLALRLPTEALLRALGAPASAAGGEITLRIERLSRAGDVLDARLAVRWSQASVAGQLPAMRIALGEVRAELSGQGREIPGTIANSGGEVDIGGTLVARADGSLRIEAGVRPREGIDREHAAAIAAALALLGSPDGRGGYRVAWAGAPL